MEHGDWSRLREPWERLRWARVRWQQMKGAGATARAAAESLGEKEGTYAAYERSPESSKHTNLDTQRAIQFGRKFQCNWVWLLTGEETPFERSPAQQRVVQAMAPLSEKDQLDLAETLETLAQRKAANG